MDGLFQCRKCGPVSLSDCYRCASPEAKDGYAYKCKSCNSARVEKRKQSGELARYHSGWRSSNPHKFSLSQDLYRLRSMFDRLLSITSHSRS